MSVNDSADDLNDYLHRYSADGLSTDNQTNLAIKGIIAIKAMSQMSSFVNNTTDFEKYSVRAAFRCCVAKLTG